MAILYAPWFFIGHYSTLYVGTFEPNGYTFYYQWAIRWSTIVFTIIGLFFCRLVILNYFSEWVTLITLVGLLYGTNLFFYTYSWGGMPHAYLFALIAFYLFSVVRWHQKQNYHYLWMALLVAGFCDRRTRCINTIGNRICTACPNPLLGNGETGMFLLVS